MHNSPLAAAIENFAFSTHQLTDPDLDRPWKWREYEEGVRFAFFRTYEQLSELSAHLEVERVASPHPLTVAQRILGQYHAATLDLQAVLLGVTDEVAAQAPAEGEWSLRHALAHIIQTDRGFFANINYGLERARTGDGRALEMTEDIWNNFWSSAPFAELSERGTFTEIQSYHTALHPRILHTFSGISTEELRLPIYFWEGQMPLEFRLHRFSSHLRQHTIQIDKTLVMLGLPPSEARRLLRMVYNALAAVESAAIGVENLGQERQNALAEEIERRTTEIMKSVA
jgi:uncharacterized damage-inducible protein DinB